MSPGDCLLTGLCGLRSLASGPPSGLMFLALGLVLYGAGGLWRFRRRKPKRVTGHGHGQIRSRSPAIP
jgi:hypothetical protein